MEQSAGIYVHIPFCLRKCLYCAFPSTDDAGVSPTAYVAALLREMMLTAASLEAPFQADTLFFGGGTPSLLDPGLVAEVIDAARRHCGLALSAEITLEANPGTVDREKLALYREAGVNRLSLGIQSFSDALLLRLGRVHNASQARHAFDAARDAGFANISIDLIHSLPGQDLPQWREELGQALALQPEHISAYGLTIEEGTPFSRLEESGALELPDEDAAVAMFEETAVILGAAGYAQYEISNFARPGFRSRHNQLYWHRRPYLGFGAGAHSFLRQPGWGVRWQNCCVPDDYLRLAGSGEAVVEERQELSRREAMAEFLFLGLRMLEGVELRQFRDEFGEGVEDVYGPEMGELRAAGLLEEKGGRLRLTRAGVILSNQVFHRFL